MHDSTIAFVVGELAQQAKVRLSFDESNPAFARRISLRVDTQKILDALALALQGTGLVAKMNSDGEMIIIQRATNSTTSQEKKVGGTIVGHVIDSASGRGLGGATVHVAGLKGLSAITSDSGSFTLHNVPAGDQMVTVKLFWYTPAERTVTVSDSERTTVRILLTSVATVLSGVVTTATGQRRKIEVGNDITTLRVDSIMQVAPITSVTDLLEGTSARDDCPPKLGNSGRSRADPNPWSEQYQRKQ